MSGTLVDLVDVCTTHAIVEEGQDLREQCARDLLCEIQPQLVVDKTSPGLAARPTSVAARRFVDIERIAPFSASREVDRNCSTPLKGCCTEPAPLAARPGGARLRYWRGALVYGSARPPEVGLWHNRDLPPSSP